MKTLPPILETITHVIVMIQENAQFQKVDIHHINLLVLENLTFQDDLIKISILTEINHVQDTPKFNKEMEFLDLPSL